MSRKGYVVVPETKVPPTPRPAPLSLAVAPGALSLAPSALLTRRRQGRVAGKRKASKRTRTRPDSGLRLPPMLEASIITHHTYRFTNPAAITTATITGGALAGALGTTGKVVNTSVVSFASSMKVISIKVWPGLAVGGTATAPTASVYWHSPVSTVAKDSEKMRSVPSGVSFENVLVSKPPARTLCGDWMVVSGVSATDLFDLVSIPEASIIDVSVSFTHVNNLAAITLNVTTAAVGSTYYLALDGPTNHFIQPVGLPTTF